MASIRITRFAGLLPEVNPRALREDHAQIAHNALLWDGWLRPMPFFTVVQTGVPYLSLLPAAEQTLGFIGDTALSSAIRGGVEPLPPMILGINAGQIKRHGLADNTLYNGGIEVPQLLSSSAVITPQNKSVYPIERSYAITYKSGNFEGPPFVMAGIGNGQGGDPLCYEGDIVTLNLQFAPGSLAANNVTAICIYRTVTGFRTGEQVDNPAETKFHLVAEQPIVVANVIYVDTADSAMIPGDLMLTEQFAPAPQSPAWLSVTESGWAVTGGVDPFSGAQWSQIFISERLIWHAWPLQNRLILPETFVDATTFYDDIFIGTKNAPYHVRVQWGDSAEGDSLNLNARPFKDVYACVSGTMVTTNSGAMYASQDGLVALEANKDEVISRRITNPGDHLLNPVTNNLRIDSISNAAWWNGFYMGFTSGVGYLYNVENNQNNEFPLGQLITFTTPAGIPGANIVVGGGFYAMWGNTIFNLPLPGYGYETAAKQTYTWKSKRFVMPGLTTFSAAKIVNDESGVLTFSLYGDGVLLDTVNVIDSEPFRINHQHKCINFEIQLVGTSVVEELHVATSMRELTEETGHA